MISNPSHLERPLQPGRADPTQESADAGAGEDDAGEVQRVGVGDFGQVVQRLAAADGPHEFEGFGAGELFAAESGNETAAADFALCFFAAERGQQIAPWWSECFAREQIAEEDAPALQELIGEGAGAGIAGDSMSAVAD